MNSYKEGVGREWLESEIEGLKDPIEAAATDLCLEPCHTISLKTLKW